MPSNVTISATFYDIEILKYPAGLDAIKSVVLDATTISLNSDPNQRTVVPAGTILQKTANGKQVRPYNAGSGAIVGILARSVDILTNTTAGNEAVNVFFHGAVFVTGAIVGFTPGVATALLAALPTCRFEGK